MLRRVLLVAISLVLSVSGTPLLTTIAFAEDASTTSPTATTGGSQDGTSPNKPGSAPGSTSNSTPVIPGYMDSTTQKSSRIEMISDACGDSSGGSVSATPGSGTPTGMTFPNLDPNKMADAIKQWIDKNKPPEGSILEGEDVAKALVDSAKKSNINPFLIPAHAKKESSLGSKNDYNVKNGNNSFGRSAASGQPQFSGARAWYKWSSGKASVDTSAPENNQPNTSDITKYIRDVYADSIDKNDFNAYMNKYAPPTENDTQKYISDFKKAIEEMASVAGGSATSSSSSSNSSSSTGGSSGCCATSGGGSATLNGDTPAAKTFSYLVGKGLTTQQAAGFVGNFMQESGGGTENLNPKASNGTHTGIAQWDNGDRYGLLQQFAAIRKKPADDIELQILYVGWELGFETDSIGSYSQGGRFKSALDQVKSTSTIEDATLAVDKYYEISGGADMGNRNKFAKEIFAKYGDKAPVAPGNSSGSASSCSGGVGAGAAKDFVYYNQNDPAWQKTGLPIAMSGCGPTSIAMVVATKKDKNIKPPDTASFLQSKGMWSDAGIVWTGFPEAGTKWGMKVTDIGTDWDKAKAALKAGKLLTISGTGPVPYTSGGHIIVARGVTDDGKIIIANPAPMSPKPEETPYQTPMAGTANMWIYE